MRFRASYHSRILLTFQTLIKEAGIDARDVRLLRHVKKSGRVGLSPYQAWREQIDRFEAYQSTQPVRERSFYNAPYWASFVGTPDKGTLFVGLYAIKGVEREIASFDCPLFGHTLPDCDYDRYEAEKVPSFSQYEGKLLVEWGAGLRRWSQYADRNLKPILELRRDESDPAYPGPSAFMCQLSQIEALPSSWRAILQSDRGVYLLTCPRTKEQYVGGAYSGGGFLGRWEQHARMEGDAIAFRSRDPEDYRVSILEVAGSSPLTTKFSRWSGAGRRSKSV